MSSMREARTSDPFSEISEMVHEQSHRIFLGAAVFWILHRNYGGDVDQWERAESDLFEKLELSELTGYGSPSGGGAAFAIPAGYWANASSIPNVGFATVTYPDQYGDTLGGTLYAEGRTIVRVYVTRSDMLKFWPERIALVETKALASIKDSLNVQRKRRGRPREKGEKIAAKMREMPCKELSAMKEVEMEALFGASRDTCRRIRVDVLSLIVENSYFDN